MDILETPEVVAAIGVMSTIIIDLIKRSVGKKHIKLISKIVPASFALLIAIVANYGFEKQIIDFIAIGGTAYAFSQGIYKVGKVKVK